MERTRRQTMQKAMFALAILLVLTVPLAAWGQTASLILSSDDAPLTGEVKNAVSFEGDILMVLHETPLSIRVTPDTSIVVTGGAPVSFVSAKGYLPGKAVRVETYISAEGETVAKTITVLSYEDLMKIRHERSQTVPMIIEKKDRAPQPKNGRR